MFSCFSVQKMSSQPFSGLAFETDYMVRIVPFPTFLNDSFFPPSFLRTNSECQQIHKHKCIDPNVSNDKRLFIIK